MTKGPELFLFAHTYNDGTGLWAMAYDDDDDDAHHDSLMEGRESAYRNAIRKEGRRGGERRNT